MNDAIQRNSITVIKGAYRVYTLQLTDESGGAEQLSNVTASKVAIADDPATPLLTYSPLTLNLSAGTVSFTINEADSNSLPVATLVADCQLTINGQKLQTERFYVVVKAGIAEN